MAVDNWGIAGVGHWVNGGLEWTDLEYHNAPPPTDEELDSAYMLTVWWETDRGEVLYKTLVSSAGFQQGELQDFIDELDDVYGGEAAA